MGEEYFNLILVFYKLMCESDVDVLVYWLLCMFEVGEDLCYVVRCLVCFVSEDVGLVDFFVLL